MPGKRQQARRRAQRTLNETEDIRQQQRDARDHAYELEQRNEQMSINLDRLETDRRAAAQEVAHLQRRAERLLADARRPISRPADDIDQPGQSSPQQSGFPLHTFDERPTNTLPHDDGEESAEYGHPWSASTPAPERAGVTRKRGSNTYARDETTRPDDPRGSSDPQRHETTRPDDPRGDPEQDDDPPRTDQSRGGATYYSYSGPYTRPTNTPGRGGPPDTPQDDPESPGAPRARSPEPELLRNIRYPADYIYGGRRHQTSSDLGASAATPRQVQFSAGLPARTTPTTGRHGTPQRSPHPMSWRKSYSGAESGPLDRYIAQFRVYADHAQMDERAMVATILASLEGDAARVCESVHPNDGWDTVIDKLRRVCDPPGRRGMLATTFEQCRRQQGETPDAFAHRLKDLGQRAFPQCTTIDMEERVLRQYVKGQPSSLRVHMAGRELRDLDRAVNTVLEIEDALPQSHQDTPAPAPRGSHGKPRGSYAKTRRCDAATDSATTDSESGAETTPC